MRRLLWLALAAALLNVDPAFASGRHLWVSVPHERGVRVDLNSVEHGQFPTGGESSPMADTRALIDLRGNIQTFTVSCSCCAPPPFLFPFGRYDEKKISDFVCRQ
jgi:hypothetical protein